MCLGLNPSLPRCPSKRAFQDPPVFIVGCCELNSVIRIIITVKLTYKCHRNYWSLSLGMQRVGNSGGSCPQYFHYSTHPLPYSSPLVTMVTFLKHKLEYYLLA